MKAFCPSADNGKFTDFSGRKCIDAFLMPQEALNSLEGAA